MAKSKTEGRVERVGALRLSQGEIPSLYVMWIGGAKPYRFTVNMDNSVGMALVKVGDYVQMELKGHPGDNWELMSLQVADMGNTADVHRELVLP